MAFKAQQTLWFYPQVGKSETAVEMALILTRRVKELNNFYVNEPEKLKYDIYTNFGDSLKNSIYICFFIIIIVFFQGVVTFMSCWDLLKVFIIGVMNNVW